MTRAFAAGIAAALALGLSGRAQAQVDIDIEEPKDQPAYGVAVRGGIAGYTGGLADVTKPGTGWGIQVRNTPEAIYGFEVSYDASRNPTSGAVVPDGLIFRNGLQGLAKLYTNVDAPLRPFVGAGVGLSFVNPNARAATRFNDDLVAEVPIAAGVEYGVGFLTAGARAQYSPFFGESFADPALPAGNRDGGQVSASVTVGGRF